MARSSRWRHRRERRGVGHFFLRWDLIQVVLIILQSIINWAQMACMSLCSYIYFYIYIYIWGKITEPRLRLSFLSSIWFGLSDYKDGSDQILRLCRRRWILLGAAGMAAQILKKSFFNKTVGAGSSEVRLDLAHPLLDPSKEWPDRVSPCWISSLLTVRIFLFVIFIFVFMAATCQIEPCMTGSSPW